MAHSIDKNTNNEAVEKYKKTVNDFFNKANALPKPNENEIMTEFWSMVTEIDPSNKIQPSIKPTFFERIEELVRSLSESNKISHFDVITRKDFLNFFDGEYIKYCRAFCDKVRANDENHNYIFSDKLLWEDQKSGTKDEAKSTQTSLEEQRQELLKELEYNKKLSSMTENLSRLGSSLIDCDKAVVKNNEYLLTNSLILNIRYLKALFDYKLDSSSEQEKKNQFNALLNRRNELIGSLSKITQPELVDYPDITNKTLSTTNKNKSIIRYLNSSNKNFLYLVALKVNSSFGKKNNTDSDEKTEETLNQAINSFKKDVNNEKNKLDKKINTLNNIISDSDKKKEEKAKKAEKALQKLLHEEEQKEQNNVIKSRQQLGNNGRQSKGKEKKPNNKKIENSNTQFVNTLIKKKEQSDGEFLTPLTNEQKKPKKVNNNPEVLDSETKQLLQHFVNNPDSEGPVGDGYWKTIRAVSHERKKRSGTPNPYYRNLYPDNTVVLGRGKPFKVVNPVRKFTEEHKDFKNSGIIKGSDDNRAFWNNINKSIKNKNSATKTSYTNPDNQKLSNNNNINKVPIKKSLISQIFSEVNNANADKINSIVNNSENDNLVYNYKNVQNFNTNSNNQKNQPDSCEPPILVFIDSERPVDHGSYFEPNQVQQHNNSHFVESQNQQYNNSYFVAPQNQSNQSNNNSISDIDTYGKVPAMCSVPGEYNRIWVNYNDHKNKSPNFLGGVPWTQDIAKKLASIKPLSSFIPVCYVYAGDNKPYLHHCVISENNKLYKIPVIGSYDMRNDHLHIWLDRDRQEEVDTKNISAEDNKLRCNTIVEEVEEVEEVEGVNKIVPLKM